ncbi:hypothetical protein EH223_17615 [candidate division KSB1 bacterium]|nr:hypothetical protein [candidate division KSB1 bacterium]RQW00569.1 MAG: hypothetical protein EH223_17615 [candidate division KSB1 bacterium]
MSFLSSIAVVVATRLGYKIAEKKKWLPSSVYHQLTLAKLRDGNLRDAIRLNHIALQKKPNYEKALIVQDVIAMQRDALFSRLTHDINQETVAIQDIAIVNRVLSRQLFRAKIVAHFNKFLPWILLFFNIFLYLLAYFFFVVGSDAVAGSLLSAGAIGCTVLIVALFRFMNDLQIRNSLQQKELSTAQRSKAQELNLHKRRLRELQSQLTQTRYQLRI